MYDERSPGQFDAAAFHRAFGTSHDLWVSGVGGGAVNAGTAPAVAAAALHSGEATHVVNVCSIAWATERRHMTGGPGQAHVHDPAKRNLEMPFGWFPQPIYFAAMARRHMHDFGTTAEQLGAIAVSGRRHANRHPTAILRDRKLTLDDYLARPPLVDPLRVEDCCLISDGGGAYVMTAVERARDLRQPVVEVAGVGHAESSLGMHWAQEPEFTTTPQVASAPPAFAQAGITPSDVDVLTLYDPFTIAALLQIEDMGFCAKGEGGPFVADGALDFDGGVLPYNTHGGMLSHAYVLGIAHVVEVVRQLRGEAASQVPDCQVGVYGGYGEAASTLVLRRAR
jgi:acetyl-CoA acetyltransferase